MHPEGRENTHPNCLPQQQGAFWGVAGPSPAKGWLSVQANVRSEGSRVVGSPTPKGSPSSVHMQQHEEGVFMFVSRWILVSYGLIFGRSSVEPGVGCAVGDKPFCRHVLPQIHNACMPCSIRSGHHYLPSITQQHSFPTRGHTAFATGAAGSILSHLSPNTPCCITTDIPADIL